MNRFARRERAEQRGRDKLAEELERETIEEEERLEQKREMVEAARHAAETAVPPEEYEAAKEAAEWFDKMWNQPGRDRKPILAFLLRRTASWIESSFLSNARSEGLADAATNVTGALFGGFDGAASTAQMAVQQADMRYRIARMAADNLSQLAREIERMNIEPYPALMEQTKDAALRIRKMGLTRSLSTNWMFLNRNEKKHLESTGSTIVTVSVWNDTTSTEGSIIDDCFTNLISPDPYENHEHQSQRGTAPEGRT